MYVLVASRAIIIRDSFMLDSCFVSSIEDSCFLFYDIIMHTL
jgi:hypothetical protein